MDSDQEFLELRALTELLLVNQRKSFNLPLMEKLILSEQLRYCYYKLTKFNCPKAWTESDKASVLIFEMMKPDLKFEVPTSRIRHRLCSCIPPEELVKNKENANKLAELLVSSASGFDTVTSETEEQECTPTEILIVNEEDPAQENLALDQQKGKEEQAMSEASDAIFQATTIKDLENAAFSELISDSDEEDDVNSLPEVLIDASTVVKIEGGELPPPRLFSQEFITLAASARHDNFLCAQESILCEFTNEKKSPRRLRGAASITAEHGQLTIIRPGRRTIMRNFNDAATFSSFFKDIEDSLIDTQDLYEHLCLYYWFKNVIRNKGVHERHWLESPIILSRGDNSLRAISLRAMPLTLGQFCDKMV